MRQCQLMRQTAAFGICWQQRREEGSEIRGVSVVVSRMCCPAYAGNEVDCCVGGVSLVKWACGVAILLCC